MAKVTGIGGVFFKSTNDHEALAAWYQGEAAVAALWGAFPVAVLAGPP